METKKCTKRKEYNKKYYKENKEIMAERNKKYYEENKESLLASNKVYREENIESIKAQKKEYYEINKEEIIKKNKEYRINNREKCATINRIYYEKNKADIIKLNRQYYKDNRELVLSKKQEYYEINKKRISQYYKKWRESNRDLDKKYTHDRNARKKKLGHTLTPEQWNDIKELFNYQCAYCGMDEPDSKAIYKEPLHQEHFVALANDGEYTHNNIIPSCKSCNSSKRNKDFFEWYPNYKHYSKNREKFILEYLGYISNTQQLSIL